MIEGGLEDISMSRAGQAGHPLPFSPGNVAYVWFDALINYIAAVGYGTDDERFATWVAGYPRHRQGHHPVPHRGVAGDAVERRRRAAAAGVRGTAGSTTAASG